MARSRWIRSEAPEFLRFLIEEVLDLDRIHEAMEYHYGVPFGDGDAADMRGAMYDAVEE
ncbi:MAG TPA: hypothetical protein VK059_14905 [Nocardioidaceae bacterium]|nr:hypothetical protein [Nocardioidaceae bacterium]